MINLNQVDQEKVPEEGLLTRFQRNLHPILNQPPKWKSALNTQDAESLTPSKMVVALMTKLISGEDQRRYSLSSKDSQLRLLRNAWKQTILKEADVKTILRLNSLASLNMNSARCSDSQKTRNPKDMSFLLFSILYWWKPGNLETKIFVSNRLSPLFRLLKSMKAQRSKWQTISEKLLTMGLNSSQRWTPSSNLGSR